MVTSGRQQRSAGGVVVRPGRGGPLVALAGQRDRNTGQRTVRLPKGHLDAGETLAEAAVREVREETGLEARILHPLAPVRYRYFERREAAHVDKEVHYFLMEYRGGELAPLDGEFERTFWCPLAEADTRLTFDTERAVVREARVVLRARPGRGARELC